ncbi:DUF6446 family protein [Pseudoroseicyclus tamaricis]|uniref:Histidine kinase n=1 Tax=Pseudoroseicyclus tamaricis TaxID=2705421 RepID=A0A6B2JU87_9RHOB|nr:DUF6446 family protein [Pseudoroseicyclus tamaricis]NDV00169.1 histidine kinase [Pseudoroseicyclus tamaricis]
MARLAILLMLVVAAAVGLGMWYLQTRAFYFEVGPEVAEVQLTELATGQPVPVTFENYQGIDADSSPIRYRACFQLPEGIALGAFQPYPAAEPLTGPRWFDCYDANQVGDDIEEGLATPLLGQGDIEYGVDRVVAVYPDGRAMSWHQINPCGAAVYDGEPAPEGCPPPPEEYVR